MRLGNGRGLGRWSVVCAVVVWMISGDSQRRRHRSPTTAYRALPVCVWPALGMPWTTARLNAASSVCNICGWVETGCWRRAGQVVCGVFKISGVFQRRRHRSPTTAHRALPVWVWPALSMSYTTARPNRASALCSRCAGECTGVWCGQDRQVV